MVRIIMQALGSRELETYIRIAFERDPTRHFGMKVSGELVNQSNACVRLYDVGYIYQREEHRTVCATPESDPTMTRSSRWGYWK